MGKDDLFKKRQASGLKQGRAEIKKERESLWVIREGESEQAYIEGLYPKKFRFSLLACLSAIKSRITEQSEARHIFVLLDGDIHTKQAIKELRKYCNQYKNVTLIVNSPCFEYWIILHFEYTTRTFIGNNQGKTKDNECEKYLKEILKKEKLTYKKGVFEPKLLQRLQVLHPQAIKNAKKTNKDTSSYSEMYKFFDKLDSF